mgnify:CR=1 FL=1
MSIITSLNKQATNLARKALRLGNDFVHPVSDDSGNTPDYTTRTASSPPMAISSCRTPLNGDRDTRPPRSLTPKPDC